MKNCIFYHRLQEQRKNLATVGVEIFVHLKGVIYAVPKAELLNGEIRFDIFELFGQCGETCAGIIEHVTHGFSKQFNGSCYIPVATGECLHPDRFQSVIQEMRIDLTLERIHLTLSSFRLFPYDLLHQSFDLFVGFLNRISQMTDLG